MSDLTPPGATTPLTPPRVPDHELIRRIGRGAYGEVWLARSVTGAFRAVKIVHRQSFDHDRPFEREFEGIQKFEPISRKHDSQVDILHVGRAEDCFYYVMELADDQATGGQINPDHYAPRTLKSDLLFLSRLSFEECVRIGLALTTALENLHGNGLVHRDVKPSNIIFVNGVPKLADIGLVTGVDATRSYVGTEGFAAPEGPGTAQADLYSLGKVLYEAATGKDRQEFPDLPTQLRELPDREGLVELNAVIARACRHDPKDRYPSTGAMRADLELLQGGRSLVQSYRVQHRLRMVRRASAAVTIVALFGLGGWWLYDSQTHELRELAAENSRLAQAKPSSEPGGKSAYEQWKPTQIATADPETGALVARLSGGGWVGLLAVSAPPKANHWWRPDGKTVTNEDFWVNEAHGAPGPYRNFMIRYWDLPEGAAGLDATGLEFVPPAVHNSRMASSYYRNGELLLGAYVNRYSFPELPRIVKMMVQLASEPWRTISVLDPHKRVYNTSHREGDPDFKLGWPDPLDTDRGLRVSFMLGVDPRFWRTQLIVVDTNGVARGGSSTGGFSIEGKSVLVQATFRGLSLAAVKEIRAEVQPVEFIEFHNIMLQPAEPTSPAPKN